MPESITNMLHIAGDYQRPPGARPAIFLEPRKSAPSYEYDVMHGTPDKATNARLDATYQGEWVDLSEDQQRPNHTEEFSEYLRNQKNLVTVVGHIGKEVVSIAFGGTEVREHPFQDDKTARLSGIAVAEDHQSRDIGDGKRESFGVGTDTMRPFMHEMKASGHNKLVLTYDKPADEFYRRIYEVQHTDDWRAKRSALLKRRKTPRAQAPDAPIIREADLRVPKDA
jgi:hypothetical protein